MVASVVLVGVHREPKSKGRRKQVREIRIAVEQTGILAQLIIDFAQQVGFPERLVEGAGERIQRCAHGYRSDRILFRALSIHEEEQLIFNHGSAKATAEL